MSKKSKTFYIPIATIEKDNDKQTKSYSTQNNDKFDENKIKNRINALEALINQETIPKKDDLKFLDNYEDVKHHLIDFYEYFKKFFLMDEVVHNLKKTLKDDNEKNPILIINYMKNIIKTLFIIRSDDDIVVPRIPNPKISEMEQDYELLLQKAENNVREYKRVQIQLKLIIKTYQDKFEEYEKKHKLICENTSNLVTVFPNIQDRHRNNNIEVKQDYFKLLDILKQKEYEISALTQKLKQKDEVIKSHEERLLTITILEHKLKCLKIKHKKEKENIRQFYEQEFHSLHKEIQLLHQTLTNNITQEEKIQYLQKELLSYKNYNIKRIQAIEEKLKSMDEGDKSDNDELTSPYIYIVNSENSEINSDSTANGLKSNTSRIKQRKYKSMNTSINNKSNAKNNSTQTIMTRLMSNTSNQNSNTNSNSNSNSSAKLNSILNKTTKSLINPRVIGYKEFMNKRKNQLMEEIGLISLARIKESEQVTKEMLTPSSSKNFHSYYELLESKLDKLQAFTTKEKDFLKSIENKLDTAQQKEEKLGVNEIKVEPVAKVNNVKHSRSSSDFLSQKRTSKTSQDVRKKISFMPTNKQGSLS